MPARILTGPPSAMSRTSSTRDVTFPVVPKQAEAPLVWGQSSRAREETSPGMPTNAVCWAPWRLP